VIFGLKTNHLATLIITQCLHLYVRTYVRSADAARIDGENWKRALDKAMFDAILPCHGTVAKWSSRLPIQQKIPDRV
jgi:hypothetical protein